MSSWFLLRGAGLCAASFFHFCFLDRSCVPEWVLLGFGFLFVSEACSVCVPSAVVFECSFAFRWFSDTATRQQIHAKQSGIPDGCLSPWWLTASRVARPSATGLAHRYSRRVARSRHRRGGQIPLQPVCPWHPGRQSSSVSTLPAPHNDRVSRIAFRLLTFFCRFLVLCCQPLVSLLLEQV